MSDDLARARAHVAAGEWLARYTGIQDPKTMTFSVAELLKAFEEGYLTRINDDVLNGDELALTATVLEAAGRGAPFTKNDAIRAAKATLEARDRIERLIKGQAALTDQRAIEQATGQRQLDDATALMTEARDLFFEYERHHRAKIERFPGRPDVPEHVAAFKVLQAKADRNALMAARLDAWLAGEDAYPVSLNPAEALRQISEKMVDGTVIKGVDHESFDRAAAYLDQPVEVSPLVAAMSASIDEISSLPLAPAQSLADVRRHWAEGAGFKYWPGGEGPPDDLDEDGEVMIDCGEQTESGPRFTMCGVGELTPMPGLWAETIDPESFGTIIGYHAVQTLRPEFETPAAAASAGRSPRDMVADEPDPRAALVHARNWLISAESLIAEAAEFIRGVTGANPGSDSADLCQRLDAWLTPMATRPADEGAEKEARRSSATHQGENHGDA